MVCRIKRRGRALVPATKKQLRGAWQRLKECEVESMKKSMLQFSLSQ